MNKWVKRKWVKALRSGEYQQGTMRLITDYGNGDFRHCCLGVLAWEMVPEFLRKPGSGYGYPDINGQTDALPDDLGILFGLDASNQSRLASMNDNGHSFTVIADWIDANL